MSVFNPRNRLVNFRLSEDEYERLRAACGVHGARSISDFARSAVLRCLAAPPGPLENPQGHLANLGQKVTDLEERVEQLIQLIHAAGLDSQELAAGATVAFLDDQLLAG